MIPRIPNPLPCGTGLEEFLAKKQAEKDAAEAAGIGLGHSIWLVPDRKTHLFCSMEHLIRVLSKLGNKPVFTPHVTLVADLPGDEATIVSEMAGLAQSIVGPMMIYLDHEPVWGNSYFHRLYLEVRRIDAWLAEAHQSVLKKFELDGIRSTSGFEPHLSLLYGDVQIGERPHFWNDLNRVLERVGDFSFRVDELELWRTIGPVEDWRYIASFPFSISAAQIIRNLNAERGLQ